MSTIIERVRNLVVLNNDHALLELSLDLRERDKAFQRSCFGGSHETGWFYLHGNEAKRRGMVFECVAIPGGETVSTLYMAHPIFNSVADLQRTREELCKLLGEKMGMDYRNMGIFDPSRGREVGVEEMATAQLIDLVLDQLRVAGVGKAETDSVALTPEQEGKVATVRGDLSREKLEHVDVLTVGEDGRLTTVPALEGLKD